jgi:hypothetical protein
MNQFRIAERVVASEELVAEFAPRVLAIGRILPMLEPWCVCMSAHACAHPLNNPFFEHPPSTI